MAIDPAERLLNLIIALTHARARMTRAQIRASVAGYEPADPTLDPETAARKDAAFERMFERDKDDLRRMGIPLQTVVDPAHGDEIGYRIDPTDAAMAPIDFTPAERAVVGLAAEYWADAAVGADARQALTKLASASGATPAIELPLSGRASTSGDALAALAEARSRRQAVRFEYHAASSGSAVRTVEPWTFRFVRGAQYVIGFDRDRQAQRNFRLNRIAGAVKPFGPEGAYEIPDPLPADDEHETPLQTATVLVRPEAGHVLRRRGTYLRTEDGWDVFEVDYRYADALRDQILMLGGAARVLEPHGLAASVEHHARKALEVTDG